MDTKKIKHFEDDSSVSSIEKEISEFINKSESQSKVVKKLIEAISKANIVGRTSKKKLIKKNKP
jgi:hypothetical protein